MKIMVLSTVAVSLTKSALPWVGVFSVLLILAIAFQSRWKRAIPHFIPENLRKRFELAYWGSCLLFAVILFLVTFISIRIDRLGVDKFAKDLLATLCVLGICWSALAGVAFTPIYLKAAGPSVSIKAALLKIEQKLVAPFAAMMLVILVIVLVWNLPNAGK